MEDSPTRPRGVEPAGRPGHSTEGQVPALSAHTRDSAQMLAAWRRGRVLVTPGSKHVSDHHAAWRTWPPAWG